MTDQSAIILTIVSTAAGSAASWFISRWYYRRSGSDLDAALRPLAGNAQKLLQGVNSLGRMLEQSGLGTLTYDESGNITGIFVRKFASDSATTSDAATATVMPPSEVATALEGMLITRFPAPLPTHDHSNEQPSSSKPEADHAN
jgi:hypothetical protein